MNVIDTIFQLFAERGLERYGEDMNQLEHALQCASLARLDQRDEPTIIAALLHDLGHLFPINPEEAMDGLGHLSHEKVGANFLRQHGFPEKVAALIEGHVAAKRYLTYAEPNYYAQLSDASRRTLAFQGGPMDAQEALAFSHSPYFQESIDLRRWDELGKQPDLAPGTLEDYRTMMGFLVNSERSASEQSSAF